MSVLEWPADLTDFRLPSAWDRRPPSTGAAGIHPSKPAPCSYVGTTACDAIRTSRNGFGIAWVG